MYASEIEEESFSIGDIIVSYSDIEISHANDNRPPLKFIVKKVAVWAIITIMAVGLLFVK